MKSNRRLHRFLWIEEDSPSVPIQFNLRNLWFEVLQFFVALSVFVS